MNTLIYKTIGIYIIYIISVNFGSFLCKKLDSQKPILRHFCMFVEVLYYPIQRSLLNTKKTAKNTYFIIHDDSIYFFKKEYL